MVKIGATFSSLNTSVNYLCERWFYGIKANEIDAEVRKIMLDYYKKYNDDPKYDCRVKVPEFDQKIAEKIFNIDYGTYHQFVRNGKL